MRVGVWLKGQMDGVSLLMRVSNRVKRVRWRGQPTDEGWCVA